MPSPAGLDCCASNLVNICGPPPTWRPCCCPPPTFTTCCKVTPPWPPPSSSAWRRRSCTPCCWPWRPSTPGRWTSSRAGQSLSPAAAFAACPRGRRPTSPFLPPTAGLPVAAAPWPSPGPVRQAAPPRVRSPVKPGCAWWVSRHRRIHAPESPTLRPGSPPRCWPTMNTPPLPNRRRPALSPANCTCSPPVGPEPSPFPSAAPWPITSACPSTAIPSTCRWTRSCSARRPSTW